MDLTMVSREARASANAYRYAREEACTSTLDDRARIPYLDIPVGRETNLRMPLTDFDGLQTMLVVFDLSCIIATPVQP
jgi:hypothetical protein